MDNLADNSNRYWQLLRKGDAPSFKRLYEIYWEELYRYACRLLDDKDQAADIVQELFSKLWEKQQELPEVQQVSAYLYTWTKHLILNHIKLDGIRQQHRISFERVLDHYTANTVHNLHNKELFRMVVDQASLLPERMKEIFFLNYIHQLTVQEIAEKLQLSDQTVRNQLNMAIHRLRPATDLMYLLYGVSITLLHHPPMFPNC